jgi:hypothetical protein
MYLTTHSAINTAFSLCENVGTFKNTSYVTIVISSQITILLTFRNTLKLIKKVRPFVTVLWLSIIEQRILVRIY